MKKIDFCIATAGGAASCGRISFIWRSGYLEAVRTASGRRVLLCLDRRGGGWIVSELVTGRSVPGGTGKTRAAALLGAAPILENVADYVENYTGDRAPAPIFTGGRSLRPVRAEVLA